MVSADQASELMATNNLKCPQRMGITAAEDTEVTIIKRSTGSMGPYWIHVSTSFSLKLSNSKKTSSNKYYLNWKSISFEIKWSKAYQIIASIRRHSSLDANTWTEERSRFSISAALWNTRSERFEVSRYTMYRCEWYVSKSTTRYWYSHRFGEAKEETILFWNTCTRFLAKWRRSEG